jgi:hypothetical protein
LVIVTAAVAKTLAGMLGLAPSIMEWWSLQELLYD